MKIRSKISAFLVLLTLLFTVALSLSSCQKPAGNEEILSKDELTANAAEEKKTNRDFVWEYLDKWGFPRFDRSKLKKTEKLFRDYYYTEVPSPYELAKTVAADFIENYYDEIDLTNMEEVTDAYLYALVDAAGDNYSFYRPKEDYKDYTDQMSGTKPAFYGIGISVSKIFTEDGILVLSPIRHSPAYKAGIIEGDVITAIDGERVLDMDFDTASAKIKGESGTRVVLTIKRGESIINVPVTRGPVVNPSVDFTVTEDKIGYIVIKSFNKNTDELFTEAVDYMKESGALAVIYDVRDNGGGYLDSVVNMLDYIAKDGTTLVSFSNDYDKPEVADDGHSYSVPTVIICNGYSASASELFTACMRDMSDMGHFPISIVGQTTYGKCIMQNTYTLSDGSAVTLTVAYYFPPSGVHFNGEGLTPNVQVENKKNDAEDKQLLAAYTEAQKLLVNQ